jgi:exopolyphosphatase/guanosine-5'-triphosphate,3'-diphosphate pyrophosphatase
MIVGELRHGQLVIIDRIKETVRLSEGLDEHGSLTAAARQRATECLSRFGQRLQVIRASSVRTAGTSALRRASDSSAFRKEAERALGHPIEVISGIEEARLIFKGVTESLPPNSGLRLVLDIGGGSTELILGQGRKPTALESLSMGCVLVTEKYFNGGRIDRKSIDNARLAASLILRPVKAFFRDTTELEAIGTSGTIIATEAVAREVGIIEADDLTPDAVEQLIDRVLEFDNVSELSLPGLSAQRSQVWPGGLAILVELLEVLRIDRLKVSDGALREGLLYDHIGRLQHEDARERSVHALARRFNIDEAQAVRVADTAASLLQQSAQPWLLEGPLVSKLMEWAARLHEIGLDISHDGFQRHGAYIAENADLPGFPRSEQAALAFVIASQREPIDMQMLRQLASSWRGTALRVAIIHRLAVLLNRSRSTRELPEITLDVSGESLKLKFPDGWLTANPLTIADLIREKKFLVSAGFDLSFS